VTNQVIGWWQFDGERIALTNSLTGQSVRYIGAAAAEECATITNSGNRTWLRFEYQDRETRYPLLVEWRNVPANARPLVWRVDHDRSAQAWRQVVNTDALHPAYGLWRRVDDCVTDAFACWPSHPLVGRYPTCVALNGGWLNGAWTAAFFRAIWRSRPFPSTVHDLDRPLLPAINASAPAPWKHVSPHERSNPDGLDFQSLNPEPARFAQGVERLISALPHMVTADGTRLLVGIPWREGLNLKDGPTFDRARLLYADSDIITDAFAADVLTSGGAPLEWRVHRIEAGSTFIGLRRRADGEPIPPILHGRSAAGRPPSWVTARLAQSLIDARLSSPELAVGFWPKADEANAGFEDLSPEVSRVDISCGGAATVPIYAGTSLVEAREGPRSFLSPHLFDDERDGIVRGSALVKTIGHWSYDPETKSLVNLQSDQRLHFIGQHSPPGAPLPGPAWNGGQSWQFAYRDAAVEYPVVVRSQMTVRDWGFHYCWDVDHVESAGLWRNRCAGPAVPPYGLWRRVDSCVLDAFLCWPDIEATGPAPGGLAVQGGWSNGRWTDRLHRDVEPRHDFGYDPLDGLSESPVIEPLDAEALRWSFVDAADMAGHADLPGVQELAPGKFFLPQDSSLAGLECYMPHLLRDDGKAVILPAGWRKTTHHDPNDMWFLYADEEVFFFFGGARKFRQLAVPTCRGRLAGRHWTASGKPIRP